MATKKKVVVKKSTAPKLASSAVVSALTKALQSKFGASHASVASSFDDVKEHISLGIDVLDWYVLGRGGLPIGRMSEWFGPENCGKTALGYHAAAQAQRQNGVAVWIVGPGEGDIDRERAVTFGVNLSDLVIVYPENLDECMELQKSILGMHKPANGPMLLVWDSIASMVTEKGSSREAGSRLVGDVPLMLSEELKKITPMLQKHRAHLFATNQIRAKIGVMFGDNTTTPGGNAPKYYASQRVQFFGGKAVKNSKNEHVAKIVTLLTIKNRFGPPFLKAKVRFDYATGYNNLWSTIWHAKTQKLIKTRAEGFSGPSYEGLEAYKESLSKLGWMSGVPLPSEVDDMELELSGDSDDRDDEDDED